MKPLALAPLAAALAAAVLSPVHAQEATNADIGMRVEDAAARDAGTRAQVRQKVLQARAAGWQGYGKEVTRFESRPGGRPLTRAEVVADLRRWRAAGALQAAGEAGPSEQVLAGRVALYEREVERHARAQARAQQRLAQEAAARQRAATGAAWAADGDVFPRSSQDASASPLAGEPSAGPQSAAEPPPGLPAAPGQPEPWPGDPAAMVDSTRPRAEDEAAGVAPTDPGRADAVPLPPAEGLDPGEAVIPPEAPPQARAPLDVRPPSETILPPPETELPPVETRTHDATVRALPPQERYPYREPPSRYRYPPPADPPEDGQAVGAPEGVASAAGNGITAGPDADAPWEARAQPVR